MAYGSSFFLPLLLANVFLILILQQESERVEFRQKKRRRLGLLDGNGRTPFYALYNLDHPTKFRENFCVSTDCFDALFELVAMKTCKKTMRDPELVLAVILNWIGAGNTIRQQ